MKVISKLQLCIEIPISDLVGHDCVRVSLPRDFIYNQIYCSESFTKCRQMVTT